MREMYARGYADRGDVEVTLGIEIREDDVEALTIEARSFARRGLNWGGGNHIEVVREIERHLAEFYPDRAYFIETEEDGKGVQVFDPRDFVKERCECPCTKDTPEANPNQLELPFPLEVVEDFATRTPVFDPEGDE